MDRYTYLGSVLDNTLDQTHDVQRRVHLASATFGRLSHRVFLNRDIAVKTKIAVYNAVCASTLLYGCEAWTVYRRHVKMLENSTFLAYKGSIGCTGGIRFPAQKFVSGLTAFPSKQPSPHAN